MKAMRQGHSLTSVERSKTSDIALVVSVVLCHHFTKLKVTKMQNGCQDVIHCVHLITAETQKTEPDIQLVVSFHVCLQHTK